MTSQAAQEGKQNDSVEGASGDVSAAQDESQDLGAEISEQKLSSHLVDEEMEKDEELEEDKGLVERKKYVGAFLISRTGDTHANECPKRIAQTALLHDDDESQDPCSRPEDGLSEKHSYTSKAEKATHSASEPPLEPASITSLANDLFINELRPLPSRDATRTTPREPGAHAVLGRPAFAQNEGLSPRPPSVVADQSDIVHEAVVCTDMETEAMQMEHDPSSAAFTDPEFGMVNTDEVVDAKILPEQANRNSKHSCCGWLLLLFLLMAGTAVLLPLLLPSNDGDNPDIADGAALQTSRPLYPPFQDDLPTAMVNFIKDPKHPHSFANAWIWQDPHRNTYSPERQIQRFHLVSFYHATQGDNWYRNDDWLSYEVSECDWFSQHHNDTIPRYDDYPICDQDNNYVVLNLASNNLQGHFPLVRNFIETLRTYDISNNNISGSLPSAASPLLEVFIVSNNKFEGLLVGEGNFAAFDLRVIKLDGNALYGVHEPLFMFLKSLEVLDIAGNHFSGRIPKTATLCSNLTHFGIADNEFEGTIPSELAVLTKLEQIDFSGNSDINGTIPSELGLLTGLSQFDISGTAVSGEVPASLCSSVEAQTMDVVADCGRSLDCCGQ